MAILLISSAGRVSGTPPAPTNTAEPPSFSISPNSILSNPTSTSRSSCPVVPTSNPLTLAQTAIDDRVLVPQSDGVGFRFGQSTINGVSYTNALLIRVNYPDYPGWVEINAGRSRHRFLGDLGVPDDQKSGSAYKVDVSFDNAAPIFSTDVRFGEKKRLDLNVTNVLRIRISISPIARSRGYLAIGNPRFR
jgi:hypothetical protein